VTADVVAWVCRESGKHVCSICGGPIPIWPAYFWSAIPTVHNRCALQSRTAERHPLWKSDRAAVRGGRGGAYFLPKIKRQILERDGDRCRNCGTSERLQVDHVVPVCEGGEPTLENGQTLCIVCHYDKTLKDRARDRRVPGGPR
jgi:5-methylcytosine-specific restriction protein A